MRASLNELAYLTVLFKNCRLWFTGLFRLIGLLHDA